MKFNFLTIRKWELKPWVNDVLNFLGVKLEPLILFKLWPPPPQGSDHCRKKIVKPAKAGYVFFSAMLATFIPGYELPTEAFDCLNKCQIYNKMRPFSLNFFE